MDLGLIVQSWQIQQVWVIEWGGGWDVVNRIPTDTEFNNRLTQRRCARLLWMECAGSHQILRRWKTCCCRNCSKLLIPKLQENLGAATYNSCHSHCHNGRMSSCELLHSCSSFKIRLNCWRIVLWLSLLDPLGGWTAVAGISGIFERTRGGERHSVVGCVAGPREMMWPANDQWRHPVSGRCPSSLNTKRKNNWAANTWKTWATSRNAASSAEWVN